jgi:hypothetical protein
MGKYLLLSIDGKVLSHCPVCCWIDWLLMIKNCLIESAIYRQQKVLSHCPVCCWIDWLLMIKNCLIESAPPCMILARLAHSRFPTLSDSSFTNDLTEAAESAVNCVLIHWSTHVLIQIHGTKKSPWPESASELYRQSDCHLSARLVPTSCG